MIKTKYFLRKNYYTYIYQWNISNPCGVVQIVHGSKEHSLRYSNLVKFLNQNGYNVWISDVHGHGISAQEQGQLGQMGIEKEDLIINDFKKITKLINKKFPQIPQIMLGYSMGTFIVRKFAMTNSGIDAYIVIGSNNKGFMWGIWMLTILQLTKLFKGGTALNHFIDTVTYKKFRKVFKNKVGTWTSSDLKQVAIDEKDTLLGIELSNQSFLYMVKWVRYIAKRGNIKNHSSGPILFLTGGADPINHGGKECLQAMTKYKKAKKNAFSIIYPNMRHELHNDLGKEQVFSDILTFLKQDFIYHN